MANELKILDGTQKTLEASGASTADAAFSQADDASLTATDNAGYPFLRFVLGLTFSVAPAVLSPVYLYQRRLNIDGTNDAPIPDATYTRELVGTFRVDAVTLAQYVEIEINRPTGLAADYYIENQAGQTISAGWTLKVTPFTYQPGA